MTIYQELMQRVEAGESFHINFEKRTMKVGKTKLIDNGEYDKERQLIEYEHDGLDFIIKII